MVKKTIFVFCFIFFIQLLFSCLPCNCPDPKAVKFDFDFLVFETTYKKTSFDNEIAFSLILKDSSNLVAKNQFIGTFMNQALACKCAFENYGIQKTPIKQLKIFTKNNFNKQFLAGDDITDQFVFNEKYDDYSLYKTIQQFVQSLNDNNYYYNYGRKIEKKIYFYSKIAPETKNNVFIVNIEFENGTFLETETLEFISKN